MNNLKVQYMMNIFTKTTLFAALAALSFTASAQDRADLLWIAGDATPWGWNLDEASCLVATPENASVFKGTLYLKADQSFKFMTTFDWGNEELRATVADARPGSDGKVALARVSGDDNDFKILVGESANYLVTVDTEAMTALFVKSAYQDTQINFSAIFMVGDPTPNGWDLDKGMTLRQNPEAPYEFTADHAKLKTGDFKLYFAMKAARSWNSKYFYFRDPDDAGKMISGSADDNKWSIETEGSYNVTANTKNNTISIAAAGSDGVGSVVADSKKAVYFNLQGLRVDTPASGQLLIKVEGGKAKKIVF